MHWLVRQLRESQAQAGATRGLRRPSRKLSGRKVVMPERLEPRNAPGVMLPLLPVLELPMDEPAIVDRVDQLDRTERTSGLSNEYKVSQENFFPAALNLSLSELDYDSVKETVAEAASTNPPSIAQDLQQAVGIFFDRVGTAANAAEELIPQVESLPPALTVPEVVTPEVATNHDPPPQVVAPVAATPPPAVASSTSSVAAIAEVAPPSNYVAPAPVISAQQPTAAASPIVVAATQPTESVTIAVPEPVPAATEVATSVDTEAVAAEESAPVVVVEPVVTSAVVASPTVDVPAATVVETNQTTTTVPVAEPAPIVVPESIPVLTQPVVSTVVEPEVVSTTISELVTSTLANAAATVELTPSAVSQISAADVDMLLSRAAKVTNSNDAIIAIVDRGGHILGVHVEQGVLDNIADANTRVFAIDGAIAKARTAAFFSNDQAPLTSRTVRFISQSTVTQREVQSNPNVADPTVRGPGFVAPIGLGGHFPPAVLHTPHVDLFAIEHTNRDSLVHPGLNRTKEVATVNSDGIITAAGGDDIFLGSRFGANFVPGQEIDAPDSYGVASGLLTRAQSRGIATLPGGVPLYKIDPATNVQELVGGIGVFFPGTNGQADFEQGFVPGIGQTTNQRTNASRVLEAEYIAAVTALNQATIGGMAPVSDFVLRPGRIDLVGITLEGIGPHPGTPAEFLARIGSTVVEGAETGMRMPVTQGGALAIAGEAVPEGWLVNPTASADGLLSAADVDKIINDGITEANLVRSAIRLPLGTRSKMVLSVADKDGTILGLFRMPDATFFSIDVAVAKARNVAYYADPTDILSIDQVDFAGDGTADIPAGTALTNRTFRYLAEPRFPSGVDGSTPPPFSILRDPGINPLTAENLGAPTPASSFTTVLGFDAFNPSSNFREPVPTTGFQNGIVFFPGSSPLYNSTTLVGGFGVSGDGVDQDDVVTFSGGGGFLPRRGSGVLRSDEVFVDNVRLPYQKFLRNPRG